MLLKLGSSWYLMQIQWIKISGDVSPEMQVPRALCKFLQLMSHYQGYRKGKDLPNLPSLNSLINHTDQFLVKPNLVTSFLPDFSNFLAEEGLVRAGNMRSFLRTAIIGYEMLVGLNCRNVFPCMIREARCPKSPREARERDLICPSSVSK